MTPLSLVRDALAYFGDIWSSDAQGTFSVNNPATGDLLAQLPNLSATQVHQAIRAAGDALSERPSLSLQQRRDWLLAANDILLQSKPVLAELITLEQGKPLRESVAEIEYAAGFFQFMSDHCHLLADEQLPNPVRGCQWRIRHRPAGVAALITPWNFPVAMVAKKLSAAIAAGCSTVIKPAEETPLSTIAMLFLFTQIDFMDAMINLVVGDPAPIGRILCSHPAIRVISFTGSTEVGRQLIEASAPYVKRLSLELGGNAPFIVFEDADLEVAVNSLISNKFRASGQTCVCANRVYVQSDVHDDFLRHLAPRIQALRVGNGLDPETDIGPLINRDAFDKVAGHVSDALEKGAQCLIGEIPKRPEYCWGAYYPPTVLIGVRRDMCVCQEETFGPVVAVERFDDENAVTKLANETIYGLAAYVFTRSPARVERLVDRLIFGHLGVNTGTGPAPHTPFGGMKQSGFCREGGIEGMFGFSDSQVIVLEKGAP